MYVLAGGRPITPFGIFSSFTWYRASIHEHYPQLQSDCENNGMTGFLEEVAMDVEMAFSLFFGIS